MRALQLIDTLNAGGAEQMAVLIANSLTEKADFSGLVTTRNDGILKNNLNAKVQYLSLFRKSTLDFSAIFRLRNFVKQNKVEIVHAHGTSFFVASLLKTICPKINIVYHEHFGGRKNETGFQNILLILASSLFAEIIVVNEDLEIWCKKYLFCKNISFLPNFIIHNKTENKVTFLKGEKGKRIVFLANLKHPKNHVFFLNAFLNLDLKNSDWTVHLVGKNFKDKYSLTIENFIVANKLENAVFLYDVCQDISHILQQANIGILASTDEGFPITILEYASAKLPVLVSDVGYCSKIVSNGYSGLLFDPNNFKDLEQKLSLVASSSTIRFNFAENLHSFCNLNFSSEIVVQKILEIYKKT